MRDIPTRSQFNGRCLFSVGGTDAPQLRPPVVIVTGQYELTMDAGLGNELRQQRCGELNRGSSRAFHHHMLDGASVVTQVLMRSDVYAEFKSFHAQNPSVQVKLNR